MVENPRFKSSFRVEVLSSEKVLLSKKKGEHVYLEGPSYALLAPHLYKNEKTVDELIEALDGKCSPQSIYYALMRLEEKGYIEEAKSSSELEILCDALDIDLPKTLPPISLEAMGNISVAPFQKRFAELSIPVVPEAPFRVILADHYQYAFPTPCLLIKPVGIEVWIGPLLIPGKTPCAKCLAKSMQPLKKEPPFPASQAVALQLSAIELFKWLALGKNEALEGKILSFDPFSKTFTSHTVLRRCPACREKKVSKLDLQSQKKTFLEDGGHRTLSPEKTFEQYAHLISPLTGVIDRITPTASSLPGYIAFGYRDQKLQVLSGGKGKTAEQAKASCLCEALERYSTAYQGDEPMRIASYRSLENALHPHTLLNFSEKQYQTRTEWNQNCHDFHRIPAPFDETEEIAWTPIWSLTEQRQKWIPTAYCYFSCPSKFCIADSNGCAAGNTREEAILQGFFELVERDSIALWWYSRVQRPRIDLSSFSDPYIARLQEHYASLGRELWVIDLTSDLQIPTFAAISRVMGQAQEEIVFGFGSHFDPQIALLRALTEANQSLDCTLFLKQEKIDAHFKLRKQWILTSSLKEHPYFIPNGSVKKQSDFIRFDSDDLKTDILTCEKIVSQKGMELLILDQTRSEIGLPVVRVVVPGLRHMWNRYAPGRLYDVPVELGWIQEKLKEEELNPLPVFI